MRKAAAVAVVALAVLFGFPGVGLAAAPAPTIVLSGLTASPGSARFLLTPRDLPAGASLDPASIRVRADTTELKAQVAPATDTTGAPLSILVLVLDANAATSQSYRSTVQAAAAELTERLPADVYLGLFTVGSQAGQLLAPTTDRAVFNQALSTVAYSGGLDPVEGVEAARRSLAGTVGNADRRILFLTDGRQTFAGPRNAQVGASVAGTGIGLDVVGVGAAGSRRCARAARRPGPKWAICLMRVWASLRGQARARTTATTARNTNSPAT